MSAFSGPETQEEALVLMVCSPANKLLPLLGLCPTLLGCQYGLPSSRSLPFLSGQLSWGQFSPWDSGEEVWLSDVRPCGPGHILLGGHRPVPGKCVTPAARGKGRQWSDGAPVSKQSDSWQERRACWWLTLPCLRELAGDFRGRSSCVLEPSNLALGWGQEEDEWQLLPRAIGPCRRADLGL